MKGLVGGFSGGGQILFIKNHHRCYHPAPTMMVGTKRMMVGWGDGGNDWQQLMAPVGGVEIHISNLSLIF